MKVRICEKKGNKAAIVDAGERLLSDVQNALDFMTQLQFEYGCSAAIIPKSCVPDEFFDLKTRLAGEILQKFTNYQFRIAIVGDFENIQNKSLRDFVYESNKGRKILFTKSEQEALDVFLG